MGDDATATRLTGRWPDGRAQRAALFSGQRVSAYPLLLCWLPIRGMWRALRRHRTEIAYVRTLSLAQSNFHEPAGQERTASCRTSKRMDHSSHRSHSSHSARLRARPLPLGPYCCPSVTPRDPDFAQPARPELQTQEPTISLPSESLGPSISISLSAG